MRGHVITHARICCQIGGSRAAIVTATDVQNSIANRILRRRINNLAGNGEGNAPHRRAAGEPRLQGPSCAAVGGFIHAVGRVSTVIAVRSVNGCRICCIQLHIRPGIVRFKACGQGHIRPGDARIGGSVNARPATASIVAGTSHRRIGDGRIGGIHCDAPNRQPVVIEDASWPGAQRPTGPTIGGYKDAPPKIGIKRVVGLTGSGVNHTGVAGGNGNRAHGKSCLRVGQGSPTSTGVRALPNAATGRRYINNVGVGRVHG